jgi:predicted nucleic acid-binding protein
MKIYLDSSALNRIFDDQTQARIYLESAAMLLIFMLIENRLVEIVSSEALDFENHQNPYQDRREFVNLVLQRATLFQPLDETILRRAQEIEEHFHIKGMDALHLACAEQLAVDVLITCDDRLLKRYKGKLLLANPAHFTIDFLQR